MLYFNITSPLTGQSSPFSISNLSLIPVSDIVATEPLLPAFLLLPLALFLSLSSFALLLDAVPGVSFGFAVVFATGFLDILPVFVLPLAVSPFFAPSLTDVLPAILLCDIFTLASLLSFSVGLLVLPLIAEPPVTLSGLLGAGAAVAESAKRFLPLSFW